MEMRKEARKTIRGDREQRRALRVRDASVRSLVRMRVPVQVVDISKGGVLIQTDKPVEVGAQGTLHLMLGESSFTAAVTIRHVSLVEVGHRKGSYRVGAAFIGLTTESRQAIEQWATL